MAQTANAPLPVLEKPGVGLPVWAPGAAGLAAGLIALALVMAGSSSWMALGAALVVWTLCGWAIYFRPPSPVPVVAALGNLLLLSAATAALAVLSGLYLLFLGPSWIL